MQKELGLQKIKPKKTHYIRGKHLKEELLTKIIFKRYKNTIL